MLPSFNSPLLPDLLQLGAVMAPRVTWAGKPLATAVKPGQFIRVSDLNDALFYSTGTYWRPVNGRVVLGQIGASSAALTGTTAETLFTNSTILVPGGLLGPNGMLMASGHCSATLNNANVKTFRLKYGGTQFLSFSLASLLSGHILSAIRNTGVTNAQRSYNNTVAYGVQAGGLTAGAVDTTIDQSVTVTGQLAVGTDSIQLDGITVEALVP